MMMRRQSWRIHTSALYTGKYSKFISPEAKTQRSKTYLIPLLTIHSVIGALVFIRDDTYTDNVDGSCLQGDYSLALGNNARLRTRDITLANAPSRAESFVDSLGLFLVIFLFP